MAALSTVALLLLCIAQEVNSTPVHDLARTIAAKAVNPVWASDAQNEPARLVRKADPSDATVTTDIGPYITSVPGAPGQPSRWSSTLSDKDLQKIWTDPSAIESYGYNRPLNTTPPLTFGFWPLTWTTNVVEGEEPNGQTRPGGVYWGWSITPNADLSGENSTWYCMLGDYDSVFAALGAVGGDCDASGGLAPSDEDLLVNTTFQTYRDNSFAFVGANLPGKVNNINETFVDCVNRSLARNLLITGFENAAHGLPLSSLGIIVASVGSSAIALLCL